MFHKKSIAVGLVAALGTSTALAAFDLDSATQTANTFALETLDSGDSTTVATTAYPNVNDNGANDLDVTALLGVGVANTEDLFIRYDLTNGVFGAAPTFTTANATATIAQGGTAGAGFVIFQVSATADIPQTQTTALGVTSIAGTSVPSGVTVEMNVFETLTQATSAGTPLVSKTATSGASLVAYASGLTLTAAAATTGNTADVESDFKNFVATGTNAAISATVAEIGSSTLAAASLLNAANGAAVAIGDMINTATSTAVVSGDFSIATHTIGYSANCANAATITGFVPNTDGDGAAAVTVAALNAGANICYTADGTVAIPEGEYPIAYTLVAAATTRTNQTTSLSGTAGEILHNGTTVQLPYLTTFEDYNQRIVMVNRSATEAAYNIPTFQTEDGVTATGGTAASGTIPAGGTLVVKVSDVVSLSGGTRAAATLNIVAPEARISVATTQVNLDDASTDTIKLL